MKIVFVAFETILVRDQLIPRNRLDVPITIKRHLKIFISVVLSTTFRLLLYQPAMEFCLLYSRKRLWVFHYELFGLNIRIFLFIKTFQPRYFILCHILPGNDQSRLVTAFLCHASCLFKPRVIMVLHNTFTPSTCSGTHLHNLVI